MRDDAQALNNRHVDVIVVGSGVAGLTAAITARILGLDVVVLEKESVLGGTSATSGGEIWIPCNDHSIALAREHGTTDDIDGARTYLRHVIGAYFDESRVETYLRNGPDMVRFIERETDVRFLPIEGPDYFPETPGASFYRTLATRDYTADALAELAGIIKSPLPQFQFLGFTLGSRAELAQFIAASSSIMAFAQVAGKLCRHCWDVALRGRSRRLVLGHALVGRLVRSATDLGVALQRDCAVSSLIVNDGRVCGVRAFTVAQGEIVVRAKRAVVLAAGGYPRDRMRRRRSYPGMSADMDPVSPTPMGNTGDGINMAEAVGARFNDKLAAPAAWYPTSQLPGAGDFKGVWPHMVDRGQPGFIAVLADGRRFANESLNYHDFVVAMLKAMESRRTEGAWLIGDARAVGRWGMGFARPRPMPRRRFVASGYLIRSNTVEGLAQALKIDADALTRTVNAFNEAARKNADPEFKRGLSAYDGFYGDRSSNGHPTLAPLEAAPFYAVRIYPGEIATFKGLAADNDARVLGGDGRPIEGLYAVGNDQASVFGGTYPGAGATLGPGMVFGWLAAKHIAAASPQSSPIPRAESQERGARR